MHRTITITAPHALTDALADKIEQIPEVLSLTVQRGAGRKPAGDVLVVHVLNRGADGVFREAQKALDGASAFITTAEVASASALRGEQPAPHDVDKALWEEVEAGLRHAGQPTVNFLALMALGGAVAGAGLVCEPTDQAVAFVAASVIAPAFEPVAMVPVGLALRRWRLVQAGLLSAAFGYGALVLSAGLTLWLLFTYGAADPQELTGGAADRLARPGLPEALISTFGAAAGVVMLTAFRRNVIAGPLIALALVPTAAVVGGAVVTRHTQLAGDALLRLGIDAAQLIALGVVVTLLKQALVHRRRPIG